MALLNIYWPLFLEADGNVLCWPWITLTLALPVLCKACTSSFIVQCLSLGKSIRITKNVLDSMQCNQPIPSTYSSPLVIKNSCTRWVTGSCWTHPQISTAYWSMLSLVQVGQGSRKLFAPRWSFCLTKLELFVRHFGFSSVILNWKWPANMMNLLDILSDDPGAPHQTFSKFVRHVWRDWRISRSLGWVAPSSLLGTQPAPPFTTQPAHTYKKKKKKEKKLSFYRWVGPLNFILAVFLLNFERYVQSREGIKIKCLWCFF